MILCHNLLEEKVYPGHFLIVSDWTAEVRTKMTRAIHQILPVFFGEEIHASTYSLSLVANCVFQTFHKSLAYM